MQANEEQTIWLGLNAILEHTVVLANATTISRMDSALSVVPTALQNELGLSSVQVGEKRPWGISFEEVRERLDTSGRAYVEGDGSFVLCGNAACLEQNKQTLWLGQLPQVVQFLPTNQWREPMANMEARTMVWRIEGNLCDGARGLDSISLNGWAPWTQWQSLLALIGPTSVEAPFTIQLHHYGVYASLARKELGCEV